MNPHVSLVERDELIAKTVDWLSGTTISGQVPGVLLVGRPGAGTTSVALAVAERLRTTSPGDTDVDAQLVEPMIIHDAHRYTDDEVATMLAAATEEGRGLIVTAREGADLPAGIARRWSEGSLWRADVRPLTEQGVADLVEQMLGARPALNLFRPLHLATDGLPLFLREAIAELSDRGEAALVDGVLVRAVPYLSPGPRLVALVRQRLADRTAGCRQAIEAVAVAGFLPLRMATAMFDAVDLETAESSGLLAVTADNEFVVVPPIVAEAIERGLSVVGRTSIRQRLLEEADEADAPPRLVIRMGQWLLDNRDLSRVSLLLRASELAAGTGEIGVSGRLARSVLSAIAGGAPTGSDPLLDGRDRARARLVAARADRFDGTAQQALDRVEPLLAPGSDGDVLMNKVPARVRAQLLVASVQHYTLGDYEEAVATLDSAAEGADEATLRHVQVQRMVHDAFAGKLAEVLPALERLDLDPLTSAADRATTAGSLIVALTEAGRGDEAIRFAERSLHTALANSAENPVLVAEVTSAYFVCRLRTLGPSGWQAVQSLGELDPAAGRFRYDDGVNQLGTGQMLLAQGYAEQALEEILGAISVFRISDPTGFMANALAVGVHAAMCCDRAPMAEQLSSRWQETPTAGSGIVNSEMGRDLLWYRYAAGGSRAVAEAGVPLAKRLEQTGMWGAAVRMRHALLRLGVPASLEEAEQVARNVRGTHMETMAEHLRGVALNDGERLLDVAERFERQGALLLAAECAAQAGDAFRTVADLAAARRAAGTVREMREQLGAVTTPILGGWAVPVGLTAREREVATLVASDMTAGEVGKQLGISRRTVEAHLQRVYDKLGVNRRGDLNVELINRV